MEFELIESAIADEQALATLHKRASLGTPHARAATHRDSTARLQGLHEATDIRWRATV